MEIFVVLDMMGAGRVVAAFDSEDAARRLVGEFPEYYKVHTCRMNHIDQDAVAWARNDSQRAWLQRLVDEQS